MQILVTGGAGYIGSVVTEQLVSEGHSVTVLDTLEKGHRSAVSGSAHFVRGDIADRELVRSSLEKNEIDAVIHMAAYSLVGESVSEPSKYYRNNVTAGIELLDSMIDSGVNKIVFSSTAAVYGEPRTQPIFEDDPLSPSNPYGETKLAFENALRCYEKAHGLRSVCLRYFNAAGATETSGEWHEPETHIIPLIFRAALGMIPRLEVFGNDYPTRDGTCIRDYIHVSDLAQAHIKALSVLDERSAVYNLGCGGSGYSVSEVIDAAREIIGVDFTVHMGQRRPGDPAVLIASSDLIKAELGWEPKFQSLEEMIGSAWEWTRSHLSEREIRI